MKYLCLVYHEHEKLDALSPPQMDALVGACLSWVEELERNCQHVFSAGLQAPAAATTVRHRGGQLVLTDGPFAETKEFLGGFTMIEARDLNEAIQIASKFPAARIGSMEVRPILDPNGELTSPLDRRIASAILRQASKIEPSAAARMVSVPSTDS